MQISEHCFAVTGLGYVPPWSVNAGFLAGGQTTLIVDTGANALSAMTIHGYANAVKRGNRLAVINTEKHFDHIGGNLYFRKQGAGIWGHSGIARTDAEFASEMEEFHSLIPDSRRREAREERVFFRDTAAANPSHAITSGQNFDLGGCSAEVIMTPGHTKTNISIWLASEGVLYCGDCLVHLYLPNLAASEPPDWPVWLHSIQRIRSLDPGTIVCGHGPVAIGPDVHAVIERVSNELNDAIQRGTSPAA